MSTIALEDIYRKIDEETAGCVERKKNQPFFKFAWVRSRQSYEPACRKEVTATYQDELTAAQELRHQQEQEAFETFGNSQGLDPDVIKIIIVAFLVVLAIAWMLA